MVYYWELVEKDGTRHNIPPQAVDVVNKKMVAHDPIPLRTGTVPYAQIEHFRQTNKPYGVKLLDDASRAFKEPVYQKTVQNGIEYTSVVCDWVKKPVTQREWDSYYAKSPSYRNLGSEGNMVMVAFRVPIHEIDTIATTICTPEEIKKLN